MNYFFSHFFKIEIIEEETDNAISSDEYIRKLLDNVLETCDDTTETLFLNVTPEWTLVKRHENSLQNFVDECRKKLPHLKIFMIFNKPMIEGLEIKFRGVDGILSLNLYLVSTYNRVKCLDEIPDWNPESKKILFMIRRSHPLHRIGLLRQLLDRGMANDMNWSLLDFQRFESAFGVPAVEYINRCLDNLSGMTFDDVQKFIQNNSRMLNEDLDVSDSSYIGINFKQNIFSSNLGQIVTETIFDEKPPPHFITEKTWLAIANKMPFVLLAQDGVDDRLKKMGFYTFDDINVGTNTYDSTQELEFLLRNGVDATIFFQRKQHTDRFENFYKMFKDPAWPDKLSWKDLKSLPVSIQTEIVRNFFSDKEIKEAIRFQSLIDRIVHFKESILNKKNEVRKMVNHNYKTFFKLGEEGMEDIRKFIKKHKIKIDVETFVDNLYTTIDNVDQSLSIQRLK